MWGDFFGHGSFTTTVVSERFISFSAATTVDLIVEQRERRLVIIVIFVNPRGLIFSCHDRS